MASRPAFVNQPPQVHIDLQQMEKKEPVRLRKKMAAVNGTPANPAKNDSNLLYGVDDVPPWYTTIVLGFQHYLLMFGGTVSLPLLVTPAMCIGNDDVGKSEIISTAFFVSGLTTLLQATLGTRLPIIQGGSFAFLPPLFAILALPKWDCPPEPDLSNLTTVSFLNMSAADNDSLLLAWRRDVWTSRMREIQGAIAVSSLFQILVGFTGILGFLLRFIGPLAISPAVVLIGLHLYIAAANYCAQQWGIAFMTIFLIMLFSQYLRNVLVPFPTYNRQSGWKWVRYPTFKMLSMFLAILLAWATCAVLTVADVLPSDPGLPGYGARTDTKLQVLAKAQWFRFPYPGQWGWPTVSAAAVLGMIAGVISGMIESVGDYYACARLSGAPAPPVHAINRGILVEGIAVMCAGLWGNGSGVTSFSENIGAIGITKVGSRRVIQVGALMMLFFGMFGKFGALFVTIPYPIVGGIFMIVFGMITAVGVSNLQFVDLNSSRNLFVFGFSLFLGLSLPTWIHKHPDAISTGVPVLDQVLTVLLSTNMFVGGFVGFVLDNTIPGTLEERGIIQWQNHGSDPNDTEDNKVKKSPYDLPFGMDYLRRNHWTSYIPFSPTFNEGCLRRKVQHEDTRDNANSCNGGRTAGVENYGVDFQASYDIDQAQPVPNNMNAYSEFTKM